MENALAILSKDALYKWRTLSHGSGDDTIY
jgi:hypothetical protein